MSSITTINGTDKIKNSRSVINLNFANLDADKLQLVDGSLTIPTGEETSIVTEELDVDFSAILEGLHLYAPVINGIGYSTMPEIIPLPHALCVYDKLFVIDKSDYDNASLIFSKTNLIEGNSDIIYNFSANRFEINGTIVPNSESYAEELYFDLGSDSLMWDNLYLRTALHTPEIKSDIITPTDLTISCGTDKTLVLTESVYNDANVGGLILRTGGTAPGVVQWLDNDGDATGIYTIGVAVNEQGSGSIEIPHDYKEGTDLVFHIHYGINDAPTGTDQIRFDLIYNVQRDGTTFVDAITIDSGDVAVDTQYKTGRIDFTAISGTNFKIGDQFNFTIKRTTAVGDAFSGEVLIQTLGFHYQTDTIGSRQIGIK